MIFLRKAGSSLVDGIRQQPFDVPPGLPVDFSLLFSVGSLPSTYFQMMRSEKISKVPWPLRER